MRSLRYIVPVLLFLVVAGFLLLGLSRNPAEIPSPLIGKPAPAWSLPRLATGSAGMAGATGTASYPSMKSPSGVFHRSRSKSGGTPSNRRDHSAGQMVCTLPPSAPAPKSQRGER